MAEIQKTAPFNWSRYERTHNNAIDLVAQCVGYHRSIRMPLRAIVLKATSFDLFKAGVRILMERAGQQMPDGPETELLFDGVIIRRGSPMQFDTLRVEYDNKPVKN